MTTPELTNDRIYTDSIILNNYFYPRLLHATCSYLGKCLDSSDVKVIIRDGLPEKLIDLCQHMDRCGRDQSNDGPLPTDFHRLILSIADNAYLFERIFGKSSEQNQKIEGYEKNFYTN